MDDSCDSMAENEQTVESGEAQLKSPTKLQVALDALEAYIAANSWSEAKHIVEVHRDVLLTDLIDDVLVMVIAQYEDVAAIHMLAQYRKVLARCRTAGIDAAFAELLTERATCPAGVDLVLWRRVLLADSYAEILVLLLEHPELIPYITRRLMRTLDHHQRTLFYALEALLDADSWHTAREIIEIYPAVLSLDADIWLSRYADALIRQGDARGAEVVTARRWLLAECRVAGVEATFSRRLWVWDGVRVDVDVVPALGWTALDRAQAV